MFIRMCGQLLLVKSWCEERGNFHNVYAVSVIMKNSVIVGHLPRKLSLEQFCVKSWEEDASVKRWHACVSKCLEYFRSSIFLWSLNFRIFKFRLWVGWRKYVADKNFLFYSTS